MWEKRKVNVLNMKQKKVEKTDTVSMVLDYLKYEKCVKDTLEYYKQKGYELDSYLINIIYKDCEKKNISDSYTYEKEVSICVKEKSYKPYTLVPYTAKTSINYEDLNLNGTTQINIDDLSLNERASKEGKDY